MNNFIRNKFDELKASGNLPSPSAVAVELLKLTQQDDVSIDQLVHPVMADPALAGQVLKLANSAFYQTENPVISIKAAIIKLGVKILPQLAMSLSILESNKNGKCDAFDYTEFWSQSLLRALTIRLISQYSTVISPEEAFTIGLVTEIGHIALAQIYPKEYTECLTNQITNTTPIYCSNCTQIDSCAEINKFSLIEREISEFAISHNQVTLEMLKDWNIPDWIVDAVNLYHQCIWNKMEDNTKTTKLATQLQLAALLTGELKAHDNQNSIEALGEALGLDNHKIAEILKKLFVEWSDWKKSLSIEHDLPIKADRRLSDQLSVPVALQNNSKMRILLVEDDRIQRHLWSKHLIQLGYSVSTASSGEDALKQSVVLFPDVLITDYHMQPMDGITLSKILRSNRDGQFVYIILITADKDSSVLSMAFEAGVNDFIQKPIKRNELEARLHGARRMKDVLEYRNKDQENIRQYAYELAANTRRLEMLVVTDQLTNLPNRRYASSRLDQEWASLLGSGMNFAILSLDLDFFKQVNDNYGHDVGDEVLIDFSKVVNKSIRAKDVFCRMGGEEFIIIAPEIDYEQVIKLGERICKMVESQQPVHLKMNRLVTVSIGAAISNILLDDLGWSDTLKRSDVALYAAKEAGRNRFQLYKEKYKRKHERVQQKAHIKVKNVSDNHGFEFKAMMENSSQSGLLLSCDPACIPTMGEILELNIIGSNNNSKKIARVARIVCDGFAVEFLTGNIV